MNELYANFVGLPLFVYFGAAVIMLVVGGMWGSKLGKTIINLIGQTLRGLVFLTLILGGLAILGFGFFQAYVRLFAG